MTGAALRRAIREAVGKHVDLDAYELFIFGSEASGSGTARSDIDIGLRGPRALSQATLLRIREELERLRTLRMFDVVDFTTADPAFAELALQRIEKI
ncbi:MAG: nucleotidyltransferase domain-containing protein [Acidobacteria bacterium]|nr:nucleotidyltransferase domain-containing protein [Acidobacteriota bacterium]MBI3263340.1 nucleotidyltransferase domain-containing protein [Acidobacteriota bacterium]